MSLLGRLFLLFVGVPLLELYVLVQMGQLVGVGPTIGLVVLTGLAGAALARLEGLRTIWKVRGELAHGRLPGGALLDGFAILLGGALLLTPGILTDLVGFSFLLPPTRKVLLGRIRNSLERRLKSGAIRITTVGGFPGGGFDPFWRQGEGSDRGTWGPETPDHPGEIVIEPDKGRDG
jgi:UPF0716 protein FxsA